MSEHNGSITERVQDALYRWGNEVALAHGLAGEVHPVHGDTVSRLRVREGVASTDVKAFAARQQAHRALFVALASECKALAGRALEAAKAALAAAQEAQRLGDVPGRERALVAYSQADAVLGGILELLALLESGFSELTQYVQALERAVAALAMALAVQLAVYDDLLRESGGNRSALQWVDGVLSDVAGALVGIAKGAASIGQAVGGLVGAAATSPFGGVLIAAAGTVLAIFVARRSKD